MRTTKTLPPNPARLIEGLRDTGYDFDTALADVVDNSVDAGACRIDVRIEMDITGDIQISVADNGCGMNEQGLLDGMTYGATGRVDPKRLGKFGLGLKTASTAFCRKLSVITRSSADSKILKAIWDLDHVVMTGAWELILEEPSSDEIETLEAVAGTGSGTVVVWASVDRLIKDYTLKDGQHARNALSKKVKSFTDHAAMTYQRFLDINDSRAKNIEMRVNGAIVRSWDPFCEHEKETELVAEKKQLVRMHGGTTSAFTIRAFVLPRREDFSSTEARDLARIESKMQGIYIYRENRLIHPYDWLQMYAKEPHFTLLRVEFSFSHELDSALQVDIKKSQILLEDSLYGWIKNEFLAPARNAAEERYRKGQKKRAAESSQGAHTGSNRNIAEKEEGVRKAEVKVVDQTTGEVEVTNKTGKTMLFIPVEDSKQPGEFCVVPVSEISDNQLWEPAIIDKHHAVRINTSHPYYHKVYLPNLNSGVTIQGLDSLLWSLVEAELGTVSSVTKHHFQELRFEVSRILRGLVVDLPDPDLE